MKIIDSGKLSKWNQIAISQNLKENKGKIQPNKFKIDFVKFKKS